MNRTTWGSWTFNPGNNCLEHQGPFYQIPLADLGSSAAILNCVYQVQEKTWASPATIAGFVDAMLDIFGRGVASGGFDHPFDAAAVLRVRFG